MSENASAERRKVAVVIPSGDMVHADFAMDLARMVHRYPELDIRVASGKSSIVADARNIGVQLAMEHNAEYMLFIDSDMVFPTNALGRLLAHDKDVVGATYVKRVPPFESLGSLVVPPTFDGSGKLLEMYELPTGFLMIRMSVFDRLKKPYFRFDVNEERGFNIGEDYLFCRRVREAGIRVWCDYALSEEIGHIGQHVCRLTVPLEPKTA